MTTTLPIASAYDSANESSTEDWLEWTVCIEAASDPALLSRVLQKAAIPEAEILQVFYDAGRHELSRDLREATVRLQFRATPSRAQSIAGKWKTLVSVHRVTLSLASAAGLDPTNGGAAP